MPFPVEIIVTPLTYASIPSSVSEQVAPGTLTASPIVEPSLITTYAPTIATSATIAKIIIWEFFMGFSHLKSLWTNPVFGL